MRNKNESDASWTSVLDLNPPNAHPFHCLPVTSWNGRVAISWPAGATPVGGEKKNKGRQQEGKKMKEKEDKKD